MSTLVLTLLLVAAAAPAADAPQGSSSKAVLGDLRASGEGPLDFRCDGMQVLSKPNRTLCKGNVVVRRGDVTICCQSFEAVADDKWQWQKLVCVDDVRARRGEETMWAERAELAPATSELVLTGRPLVLRGQSLVEGDRVEVNMQDERARVVRPRGRIMPAELEEKAGPPAPAPATKLPPLPASCPVPPAPKR